MKKLRIICKPIAFIAILLLILRGLSPFFLQNGDPISNFQKSRGILSQPKGTIDVLVLGDSESYTSFSPMELWETYGYTAYVSGLPARYVSDALEVMEKALQEQHPKYVMIETNMLFREKRDVNYDVQEIFNRYALPFMPIFKNHDAWKHMDPSKLQPCFNWQDPLKGYYINTKAAPFQGSSPRPTDKVKKLSKKNLRYADKIKKLCDEYGATLIMYSAPSMKNWTYERHNGLSELASQLGIQHLDLNLEQKVAIDWQTDTSDAGDHLNFYGAIKVTGFLGEYLDRLNTLKDKRSETAYQRWNDDLRYYQERRPS